MCWSSHVEDQFCVLCLSETGLLSDSGLSDSRVSIDGAQVQAALAAMAESEFFVAAPRLYGLLCFLVETTLADPSLKITQRFVAERFLGRGDEFDPTIDPVVRVAINRLRVALERHDAAGLNTSLRFEIPKGSYRVVIHDVRPPLVGGGELTLLRKPIAVMPVVASRHVSDAVSIDEVLHASFVDRLNSLDVDLLSIDVLEKFLADPSKTLDSASEYFGFELILSFRPANVAGKQIFSVQVSHVDGSLIWSRQYVDAQVSKVDPLFAPNIDQIANDLAGHFGVLRVSSGLFGRLSGGSVLPGLVPLEDYAIYAFRMYEMLMSTDWHGRAAKALLEAVERGSEHPLVLAKLAYLTMDQYAFSSPVDPGLLNRGLGLLSRSRKADPDNSYVLFVDSIASLYQGDYLGMQAKVERLKQLPFVSQFYKDFSVWIDALAGRFVELDSLLERLRRAVVPLPSWFWFAPFLEAYASQRFEDCLKAAVSFGCEDLFWSPLMKAVAYWGLADPERAVSAMQHALTLNMSLVDDADHYVACFVVDAGLRKSLLADIGAIQDALIEA